MRIPTLSILALTLSSACAPESGNGTNSDTGDEKSVLAQSSSDLRMSDMIAILDEGAEFDVGIATIDDSGFTLTFESEAGSICDEIEADCEGGVILEIDVNPAGGPIQALRIASAQTGGELESVEIIEQCEVRNLVVDSPSVYGTLACSDSEDGEITAGFNLEFSDDPLVTGTFWDRPVGVR